MSNRPDALGLGGGPERTAARLTVAGSADTCGWFAADPEIFARVGGVLLS